MFRESLDCEQWIKGIFGWFRQPSFVNVFYVSLNERNFCGFFPWSVSPLSLIRRQATKPNNGWLKTNLLRLEKCQVVRLHNIFIYILGIASKQGPHRVNDKLFLEQVAKLNNWRWYCICWHNFVLRQHVDCCFGWGKDYADSAHGECCFGRVQITLTLHMVNADTSE